MIDGTSPRENPCRVANRYILKVQIGREGIGAVHRAFDEHLADQACRRLFRACWQAAHL
jgi:hypothetical protein